MQERMLSPRTLHFTKKGFMFECRERYAGVQMFSTANESSLKLTFAGYLRSLEKGMEGGWGVKVPPFDQLANAEQQATMTDEKLEILHLALSTQDSIGISSYGRDKERVLGEQKDIVSWWNRNVVTDYSSRRITLTKDRLPAISGVARLFGEYIQSPYLAGIWLAEIEEGLEWVRGGPSWKDEKLDGHPHFSWMSHPGRVEYPYIFNVRGYGKAFDVISHSVTLSGQDGYGRIASAELILRGHVRHAYLGEDRIEDTARPYSIKRSLLNLPGGEQIGEVDLDLECYTKDEVAFKLYCFMLYKNSLGYPRFLLLRKTGDGTGSEYQRVGIGFVKRRYADWLLDSDVRTICLT